ncbi:MAG: hypothetical protein ACI814_004716, partial [Mariniblastus sp.]
GDLILESMPSHAWKGLNSEAMWALNWIAIRNQKHVGGYQQFCEARMPQIVALIV